MPKRKAEKKVEEEHYTLLQTMVLLDPSFSIRLVLHVPGARTVRIICLSPDRVARISNPHWMIYPNMNVAKIRFRAADVLGQELYNPHGISLALFQKIMMHSKVVIPTQLTRLCPYVVPQHQQEAKKLIMKRFDGSSVLLPILKPVFKQRSLTWSPLQLLAQDKYLFSHILSFLQSNELTSELPSSPLDVVQLLQCSTSLYLMRSQYLLSKYTIVIPANRMSDYCPGLQCSSLFIKHRWSCSLTHIDSETTVLLRTLPTLTNLRLQVSINTCTLSHLTNLRVLHLDTQYLEKFKPTSSSVAIQVPRYHIIELPSSIQELYFHTLTSHQHTHFYMGAQELRKRPNIMIRGIYPNLTHFYLCESRLSDLDYEYPSLDSFVPMFEHSITSQFPNLQHIGLPVTLISIVAGHPFSFLRSVDLHFNFRSKYYHVFLPSCITSVNIQYDSDRKHFFEQMPSNYLATLLSKVRDLQHLYITMATDVLSMFELTQNWNAIVTSTVKALHLKSSNGFYRLELQTLYQALCFSENQTLSDIYVPLVKYSCQEVTSLCELFANKRVQVHFKF